MPEDQKNSTYSIIPVIAGVLFGVLIGAVPAFFYMQSGIVERESALKELRASEEMLMEENRVLAEENEAIKLAKAVSTKSFTDKPLVSWIGWNRAEIALTEIEFTKVTPAQNKLSLFFDINVRDGGFCSNSLGDVLRLSPNRKQPDYTAENCSDPYTRLTHQEVSFNVGTEENEFIIEFVRPGAVHGSPPVDKIIKIALPDSLLAELRDK